MSNETPSTGVNFVEILALIFIVLKLVGVIDWSWWWVLSPLWIGVSAAILLLGGAWVAASFVSRW